MALRVVVSVGALPVDAKLTDEVRLAELRCVVAAVARDHRRRVLHLLVHPVHVGLREVDLRNLPDLIIAIGGRHEVLVGVDALQVAGHLGDPSRGGHDLVPELPRLDVRAGSPAGDVVPQALLVEAAGLLVGPELLGLRAGAAVGRVVGAARPALGAEVVFGFLELAVVAEAKHGVDAMLAGERHDVVEAPGVVWAVDSEPVVAAAVLGILWNPLEGHVPVDEPDTGEVAAGAAERREPHVIVQRLPRPAPADVLADGEVRLAGIEAEVVGAVLAAPDEAGVAGFDHGEAEGLAADRAGAVGGVDDEAILAAERRRKAQPPLGLAGLGENLDLISPISLVGHVEEGGDG